MTRDGAIFISHAAADKPIIDEFVDLLQNGCDLQRKDIACTSIEGVDVGTGEKFVDWIQQNLKGARLVILFVTPNYLNSSFCIAEMGAAWALEKPVHPLLGPGVNRNLGTVMLGLQTEKVDATGLTKLYDRVRDLFPEVSPDTSRWNVKMKAFLKYADEQLPNLPKPRTALRGEVEQVQGELEAAMQINKEDRDRIRTLEEQVARLEKAKDADEVVAIRRQFDSEQSQYESLTSEVGKLLSELDPVEVRCLYAVVAHSGWHPSVNLSPTYRGQIDHALESDRIKLDAEDSSAKLYANETHPSYRSLLKKMRELDTFLSEQASGEFIERVQEENGVFVDVERRDFWEKVLYRDDLPD